MTETISLLPELPARTLHLSSQDMMLSALHRDLDRPVVIFEDSGRIVTAREYLDIASRYQQALVALGVRDGARIGVLSKNRPEILFLNGGLSFVDACRVSMHPMGSADDFEYILRDASVEALIFDPDHFEEMAKALKQRVPGLRQLISLGPSTAGTDITALAETFEVLPLEPLPPSDPERLVSINYSGGTTGQPKAICASARTAATVLQIMLSEWEWPEVNRHLICAPLSHGGGAMFMPTLLRGGSMVVLPGFSPEQVLQSVQKHRITTLWLVPAMIYALLDHPRFDDYDLSSIEVIYYGASLMSPTRLQEAIRRIGPVFFQFYGQSEAPMTVTVMRRAEHDPEDLRRLASCGRPALGVRVALLDDAGAPVRDGEAGEICVQGPLLMAGYLNKPEETAAALAGGWLHTGDVAVKDADGFLRIVDRKKDMIVTGGFNIFPREVEDVLVSHPAVAAAAVVGLPHDKWGEAVRAAVVLRAGKSVDAEDLIVLVRERKGPVHAPKSIDFIDAVPLSGVGKPDKKAVRALLAERHI